MARDAPRYATKRRDRCVCNITDARTANTRQDDARIDRPNEHTDRRDRGGDGGPRDRSASGERRAADDGAASGDGRDVAVHGELRATGERDQARGARDATTTTRRGTTTDGGRERVWI